MPKGYSLNAIPRQCLQCGKIFKPMTDKKWDWAYASHTLTPKHPHTKHLPKFA